ncbi:MAG: sigma-54-dependent Fis family transcriptional regulator, partial [Cyclobacteriaceae bacterium]
VIISRGKRLQLGNLDLKSKSKTNANQLMSFEDSQRSYILSVLKLTNGKISGPNGAAQILDLNPKTLDSKMRKLGIKRGDLV